MRVEPHADLRKPDLARASVLGTAHGGRVPHYGRLLESTGMPAVRLAGLAAAENIALAPLLHLRTELRQ